MKKVVDFLAEKNCVLKSLESIDLSLVKTRKKLRIYSGVNEKSFYTVIFQIGQKSRFVKKNAQEIIDLEQKLERAVSHAYKYKYVLIASPLCSLAKKMMKNNGWSVYEVSHDTL
ncbi:hypothetical protein [Sulfurospirillum sp. 1612]|uniref:hypothetical protein n=1 Tax=Sulfurospirillum sp. 1612 TaxID=3094835 RepID=UPI002F93A671